MLPGAEHVSPDAEGGDQLVKASVVRLMTRTALDGWQNQRSTVRVMGRVARSFPCLWDDCSSYPIDRLRIIPVGMIIARHAHFGLLSVG
jgi:hypothetical protein